MSLSTTSATNVAPPPVVGSDFMEYFCDRYLSDRQKTALAFEAASSQSRWTATIAEARRKYDRRMSRWHLEEETTKMSERWRSFCKGTFGDESVPVTQERMLFVKAEDGVVRSIDVRYQLEASFYASGSCNVGHREKGKFKATLYGVHLTLQDYHDVMACVRKGEDDRFMEIEEDVHDVLFPLMSEEAQDQWGDG